MAQTSEPKSLRLWGKIYGTEKDYYIVEGILEGEVDAEEGIEPRGTGANQFVYWVTENPGQEWIQLPELHPKHLLISRQIQHLFTGKFPLFLNLINLKGI